MVSQSTREGAIWGNRRHCCSSNPLIHFCAVGKYLHIIWVSGCYFQKGFFIHFRVCGVFLKNILSKTDRSEVQIDSEEGYLTLWFHQLHPGQSLNPHTVVEFEGQEVESGWIFQRVLSLVVQKHSYKLDYQDRFSVLKHSSLTVSCGCFSRHLLCFRIEACYRRSMKSSKSNS